MAITAKPEVLAPGQRRGSYTRRSADARRPVAEGTSDSMDLLSHLLDDFIRIPGTPIRFGLDGIVGFIPGVGDLLGGLASSIIIVVAWMRGVPRVTVARMVLNVAIETAVGSLPVVGNLFDIGWRANRRNYALLTGASASPAAAAGSRHGSWLFIAGVCLVLALLMFIPMLLAGWLLLHLQSAMHH